MIYLLIIIDVLIIGAVGLLTVLNVSVFLEDKKK
jgi:hypothetical protein